MRAQDADRDTNRTSRSAPYNGFTVMGHPTEIKPNFYVNKHKVLPETYWTYDNAVRGEPEREPSPSGSEETGLLADECCIALSESDNQLWVMLANDTSTIDIGHRCGMPHLLWNGVPTPPAKQLNIRRFSRYPL